MWVYTAVGVKGAFRPMLFVLGTLADQACGSSAGSGNEYQALLHLSASSSEVI